jgi:hypothetical protein
MSAHRIARPRVVLETPALAATFALVAALAAVTPARAQDSSWPRQFDSSSGSFVIYEPQPEDLNGDLLSSRAAFSLQRSGDAQPVFGVLWFTEHVQVDRDSSTATGRDLDVLKVRMPGITTAEASRYEHLVENEALRWDLSGSLDDLKAGLAATERERASVANLDNAPPKILFVNERAILVVYDGPPALEPIEGSSLQRVANTPYAVTFDPRMRTYYLSGANAWYRAENPLGPWTAIANPPAAVRDVVPPDTSSDDQMSGPPPRVITATEPTELISTDGKPQYAPLVGGDLLYVVNTESDVLRLVDSQQLYVLLAGRWFRAPSPDGPWTFVRGDQLPAVFRQVPPDSPMAHIRASIPGTDEADDAVADAEIPQTSAIRRDDSSLDVTYDGAAQFETIDGTDMRYAINTDAEVIFADGRYYACDQGVWYISDSPDGPWQVSETRPVNVDDIPPSCPVYDVRYVYIYDATPSYVYCGYLPGYYGCYPYYGTVVYGTGYRYRPWRHRHYYSRPCTWGFHARYNPWLGRWSFGYTYWSGFLRVGYRWHRGPQTQRLHSPPRWFGPGGFRRPLYADDHTLLRTRRPGRTPRPADAPPNNIYQRPSNIGRVDRAATRLPLRPLGRPATVPAGTPNNVFAGKDGKVYQRDDRGQWKVNEGRQWRPTLLPKPMPIRPMPPASGDGGGGSGVVRRDWPRQRPQPQPSPVQPTPRDNEQRPTPQNEPRPRPQPSPVQPSPRQNEPRPSPPPVSPTPGDLEKAFHARERGSAPPAKPNVPMPGRKDDRQKDDRQKDDGQKERPRKP